MFDEIRDQRQTDWYWLNTEVVDLYGPKIGLGGVAVYNVLARLADEQGCCEPSVPYIARVMSTSENTVRKHIETLEQVGMIKRTDRGGQATVYTLLRIKGTTPKAVPDTPSNSAPLQILKGCPDEMSVGEKGTPSNSEPPQILKGLDGESSATPSNPEGVTPSDFEPLQILRGLDATPSNSAPLQILKGCPDEMSVGEKGTPSNSEPPQNLKGFTNKEYISESKYTTKNNTKYPPYPPTPSGDGLGWPVDPDEADALTLYHELEKPIDHLFGLMPTRQEQADMVELLRRCLAAGHRPTLEQMWQAVRDAQAYCQQQGRMRASVSMLNVALTRILMPHTGAEATRDETPTRTPNTRGRRTPGGNGRRSTPPADDPVGRSKIDAWAADAALLEE